MTGDELLQLGNDILDGKIEPIFPRGMGKTNQGFLIVEAVMLAAMVRKINALNQKMEELSK